MSILATEIWENRFFNGQWTVAEKNYAVAEVATGDPLGVMG